ncbi:hypothetical protein MWN34_06830 [Ancylobacter sp. 6x-1]|uniref:Uncharacterized protein n=1 Tax=Ancylobacter crimeensis TaxID=2579147 RepID=A0ABT0D9L0_9HYPH|nr:hypothetical protein [Ancylobacter crimeensis]MCK0196627.1 hypothetical protein [Ancylobacter crimeensis]
MKTTGIAVPTIALVGFQADWSRWKPFMHLAPHLPEISLQVRPARSDGSEAGL